MFVLDYTVANHQEADADTLKRDFSQRRKLSDLLSHNSEIKPQANQICCNTLRFLQVALLLCVQCNCVQVTDAPAHLVLRVISSDASLSSGSASVDAASRWWERVSAVTNTQSLGLPGSRGRH